MIELAIEFSNINYEYLVQQECFEICLWNVKSNENISKFEQKIRLVKIFLNV